MEWLIDDGLYDAEHNTQDTIVFCRNKRGLRLLIEEGYDPNHILSMYLHFPFQPLTLGDRTAEMVDALLAVGAKVELLNGEVLPSVAAFRRMMQLRPEETRAVFSSETLMRLLARSGSRQREIYRLEWVEMMREFDFPAPDMSGLRDSEGAIAAALFTFKYKNVRPPFGLSREGLSCIGGLGCTTLVRRR